MFDKAGIILNKFGVVAVRVEFAHAHEAEDIAESYVAAFHGDIMIHTIQKGSYDLPNGKTMTHYQELKNLFHSLYECEIEKIDII